MEIDFSPLKEFVDKLAYQLVFLIVLMLAAYTVVFLLFKLINMPKSVANFFGMISLLATFYFSFRYGLIPGM